MPNCMRKQANYRNISEKCLNKAKRQNLALRLLTGRKRSLQDIAQIVNVDEFAVSRIGKCLRSIDDMSLEKMLCPPRTREVHPDEMTSIAIANTKSALFQHMSGVFWIPSD